MRVFDLLRQRLLQRAGLMEPAQPGPSLSDLYQSEWSADFERFMRNRLVMGALRYGRLGATGKPQFDRVESIMRRLKLYRETGNTEMLVDVANLALVEFIEGKHPLKHFSSDDTGEHCTKR